MFNEKLVVLVSVFLVLMVAGSCDHQVEPVKQNGKVSFSFSPVSNQSNGGRTTSTDIPSYINIWTLPAGEDYYLNARYFKVEVFKFGNDFVSSPIELPPGSFDVVNFSVHDQDGNFLYGVPKVNTPFAHLVQKTLPYRIEVQSEKTVTLSLEVLPIDEDSSPEDFGYTAFAFDVVDVIGFQIAVFVYNQEHEMILTSSSLKVVSMNEILYEGDLSAATNKVFVKNLKSTFSLIVSKSGYSSKTIILTEDQLKQYVSKEGRSEVLKIVLIE